MFINTKGGPKKGEFSSPDFGQKPYPPNLQCVYTFIGQKNERVKITFDDFLLTGSKPRCELDHLDIYAELENQHTDLIRGAELSGRYCGSISPGLRISLYHVLVLVFHTQALTPGSKGFSGNYEFIRNDDNSIGRPDPRSVCGFTVQQSVGPQATGYIKSPSYPGKYPSNIYCWYKLVGSHDNRIRLSFEDFDVYFGGKHCPYDSVTIYDGASTHDPIIQKACGLQQKLEIFSKKNSLYLTFNTSDPIYAEHRGFKILYEFSNEFVNINQMIAGENGVEHIRGTECDVRVKSSRSSTHTIRSPNFPRQYPTNKTCTYILDGRKSIEELEKVILTVTSFSIASNVAQCKDASLSIYDENQDPKTEEGLAVFCGSDMPEEQESTSARMLVVFKSSNFQRAKGFQALVKFETDFGIPGKPIRRADECAFEFKSSDRTKGDFNSPRFPSQYPQPIECEYTIKGEVGEQIILSFEIFKLFSGPTGRDCNDTVTVYNIFPRGVPSPDGSLMPMGGQRSMMIEVGVFCSARVPWPVISEPGSNEMLVKFKADSAGNAAGFKATYQFRKEQPLVTQEDTAENCGANIQNSHSGIIESPKYGMRYENNLDCNWVIKVRPGFQVYMEFLNIGMEGDVKREEASVNLTTGVKTDAWVQKDCRVAAVVLYQNVTYQPSVETCGVKKEMTESVLSVQNFARVNFVTGPNANGFEGFRFLWTEVRNATGGTCKSDEFKCVQRNWCISDKLKCNEQNNCGENDNSDEAMCSGAQHYCGSLCLQNICLQISVSLLLSILIHVLQH